MVLNEEQYTLINWLISKMELEETVEIWQTIDPITKERKDWWWCMEEHNKKKPLVKGIATLVSSIVPSPEYDEMTKEDWETLATLLADLVLEPTRKSIEKRLNAKEKQL